MYCPTGLKTTRPFESLKHRLMHGSTDLDSPPDAICSSPILEMLLMTSSKSSSATGIRSSSSMDAGRISGVTYAPESTSTGKPGYPSIPAAFQAFCMAFSS